MNPTINLLLEEYKKKQEEVLKSDTSLGRKKLKGQFSYFVNREVLNNSPKSLGIDKKYGDQRSFVDYMKDNIKEESTPVKNLGSKN